MFSIFGNIAKTLEASVETHCFMNFYRNIEQINGDFSHMNFFVPLFVIGIIGMWKVLPCAFYLISFSSTA